MTVKEALTQAMQGCPLVDSAWWVDHGYNGISTLEYSPKDINLPDDAHAQVVEAIQGTCQPGRVLDQAWIPYPPTPVRALFISNDLLAQEAYDPTADRQTVLEFAMDFLKGDHRVLDSGYIDNPTYAEVSMVFRTTGTSISALVIKKLTTELAIRGQLPWGSDFKLSAAHHPSTRLIPEHAWTGQGPFTVVQMSYEIAHRPLARAFAPTETPDPFAV